MYNKYPIALIAVVSSSGIMGSRGGIPWTCKEDSEVFNQRTLNKPIIMGRRVFEERGKPFYGRTNIILSSTMNKSTPGVFVCRTPEDAIDLANRALDSEGNLPKEIYVIGGLKTFNTFLDRAERIYYTYMKLYFEGDYYFPFDIFRNPEWDLVHSRDSKNYLATFNSFMRKMSKEAV